MEKSIDCAAQIESHVFSSQSYNINRIDLQHQATWPFLTPVVCTSNTRNRIFYLVSQIALCERKKTAYFFSHENSRIAAGAGQEVQEAENFLAVLNKERFFADKLCPKLFIKLFLAQDKCTCHSICGCIRGKVDSRFEKIRRQRQKERRRERVRERQRQLKKIWKRGEGVKEGRQPEGDRER